MSVRQPKFAIQPKKKGSRNREKARRKVARLHARIDDRRRDYQHKLSTRIVYENQVVCVESLAVKNMVKNRKLAKAISDVGWASLSGNWNTNPSGTDEP